MTQQVSKPGRTEGPARASLWRRAIGGLLLLSVLIAACGGGGDSQSDSTRWPEVQELKERDITPLPLNSQLAVGDDRFLLGLTDKEDQLILRADLTLRFFKIEGEEGTLKAETPARYIFLEENFVHEHQDGTRHTHEGPEVGAYVAQVMFDQPGDWGVEIEGTTAEGEEIDGVRARFNVLEDSTVPDMGEPAPRTEQLTLRDVADISEIDTANPPRPELHEKTVAEALDTGKPVVVAFATPAFCVSRICGPVFDEVVVHLFEKYGEQVEFIHIEPYVLDDARAGRGLIPVPALTEWGLQTEPWVFIIDREGRIAGKFEAITNVEEVEAILQTLLGAETAASGDAPSAQ